MKYQTEAEAFRAIAEKLVTTNCGHRHPICLQLMDLWQACDIDEHLYFKAKDRVGSYLLSIGESGWSPYAYGADYIGPFRNDEARALACLWMALEAEEEGK